MLGNGNPPVVGDLDGTGSLALMTIRNRVGDLAVATTTIRLANP